MISVNADLISAKDLLVLAGSPDEQKEWVTYLSKKIVKKPPKPKTSSVRYVIFIIVLRCDVTQVWSW